MLSICILLFILAICLCKMLLDGNSSSFKSDALATFVFVTLHFRFWLQMNHIRPAEAITDRLGLVSVSWYVIHLIPLLFRCIFRIALIFIAFWSSNSSKRVYCIFAGMQICKLLPANLSIFFRSDSLIIKRFLKRLFLMVQGRLIRFRLLGQVEELRLLAFFLIN